MNDAFDVVKIAEKLKNLRSYYSKELKKVTQSKKSGSGTDDIYKSKWPFYDSLDTFLRTQVVPRKSNNNLNDLSMNADDDEEERDDEDNESQTSEDVSRSSTPKPFKKRKVSGAESILISEAASVLAEIKKKTTNPMPASQTFVVPEDEDTLYCKYLAEELKKIKDQRTKAMGKMKFQNILSEAQFSQPCQPAVPMFPTQNQNYGQFFHTQQQQSGQMFNNQQQQTNWREAYGSTPYNSDSSQDSQINGNYDTNNSYL